MLVRFMRAVALGLSVLMVGAGAAAAAPALKLTVGVVQSGTAQWELAAMQDLGIDKKHHLQLVLRPLANNQAGQVALQTHAVDVILSDFVWVALQRHRGNMVSMVPHSLAVGGLMVDPKSKIDTIADLKGKTVAATTPVDKSWVILQAYYNKVTGGTLVNDVQARFGAPPLINQLLKSGKIQADLNFWSWNARAKLNGDVQLISVPKMLAGLGVSETPPLLGWAFFDSVAKTKHAALTAFLDASFDTKHALLTDDDIWNRLRGVMKVKNNDKLFLALRQGYRNGIVKSYDPSKTGAAAQTFALLVKYGGKKLVEDATKLPDGTFYKGYSNKGFGK